jgi:nitric oxide reductase subunit B
MGVFGMLGVALMVFVLRETVQESLWPRLEKYVRCGFWGLNIGLAMMILFSLFPSGVLQVRDVLENGYWHARSLAHLGGELPRLLEWLRLPGDLVFIFLGALPILIAVGVGYLSLWSEPGRRARLGLYNEEPRRFGRRSTALSQPSRSYVLEQPVSDQSTPSPIINVRKGQNAKN